jgi:hypothetical protein
MRPSRSRCCLPYRRTSAAKAVINLPNPFSRLYRPLGKDAQKLSNLFPDINGLPSEQVGLCG